MKHESQSLNESIKQLGVVNSHPPHAFLEVSRLHVYRVDRGIVKIMHVNSDGVRHVKYVIMPGEWFGALAFLLGDARSYTEYILTTEYTEFTLLAVKDAKMLCAQHGLFATTLTHTFGKRIEKLERRIDAMAFGTADERVVNFLCEYFHSYGKYEDGKLTVANLLTHEEIAKLTATSRQTVSRILNRLREKEYLDYDSRFIQLLKELPDGKEQIV